MGTVEISTSSAQDGERSLIFSLTHEQPPPPGSECDILTQRISRFDIPVFRESMLKQTVALAAGQRDQQITVDGMYAAGERVYATVACRYPQLDAEVTLGISRLTVL